MVQAVSGNVDAALATQGNFSRRCPVVSQVRSVCEAVVLNDHELAAETQREFIASAKKGGKKIRSAIRDIWDKDEDGRAQRSYARRQSAQPASGDDRHMDEEWIQQMFGPQGSVNTGGPHFLLSSALRPSQMEENESSEDLLEHTSAVVVNEAMCSSYGSCPICLLEFHVGEDVQILPCFHAFHGSCAGHWLQIKGNCPVCRCAVRSTRC